jgi:hypothetical protein
MAVTTKAQKRRATERWVREMEWRDREAEIKEISRHFRKLNRQQRMEYVDALNRVEERRVIDFAVGGSLITLSKEPGWEMYEGAVRSKRGCVSNFSGRSRKRMMETVAGLLTTALPLFVTLTYPDEWPSEWNDWKFHLATFWKRVRRKWPNASAIWKLEPQERGAPHFHLLIWGVEFMPHEWLAQAWFECCGINDAAHLRAGTRVERAKSVNGVQAYMSKNYMGKLVTLPEGWDNVGRWWGIMGRKHLPCARRVRFTITKAQAFRLRRLVRRYLKSRGIRTRFADRRQLGRVTLFTQQMLDWVRALDWAGGCDIVPRLLGVPLESTPF